MTTRFLSNLRLTEDHIISAAEEAGPYMPQPVPASDNAGGLSPRASGTVATFSYDGITTGAGAGDGTTSVCSLLNWFGDDFFIGGNVAITSGACDGEDQDITDFAQATGTMTHAAFTAQIAGGVDFTLTITLSTRSWLAELIAAGNVGVATFRWSHDGTTCLGRGDPDQADYLGEREIHANVHADDRIVSVEAANRDLLWFYKDATSGYLSMRRATNGGLSIGDANSVDTVAYYPTAVCGPLAGCGHLVLYAHNGSSRKIYYSWDNGATWTCMSTTADPSATVDAAVQLAGGAVMIVRTFAASVAVYLSGDGGLTWGSSAATVHTSNNAVAGSCAAIAADGYPVVGYSTNHEAVGEYELKSRKATSMDLTSWDTEVDVLDVAPGGDDLKYPDLVRDINGDLYMAAMEDVAAAQERIIYTKSADGNATWGSKTQLKADGAKDLTRPRLMLAGGHRIVCSYVDGTNSDLDCVSRGLWEAYSANACPCAMFALRQRLTCGMDIDWLGSGGAAGDDWSWQIGYYYSKERILDDSPRRQWRSTQDNIDCRIVIDWGANGVSLTDGAVFCGCNVQKIKVEANATDSWGGPSKTEELDFTLNNGSATTVYANGTILASTGLAGAFKTHELIGKYLRMTSGTDDGLTWRIKENIDGAGSHLFFLDTTEATNINTNDTFDIFGPSAAMSYTMGALRFESVLIEAQQTAEGYYQIGVGRPANVLALEGHYHVRHEKNLVVDVDHVGPTPDAVIKAGPRWVHQLTFPWQQGATNEISAFLAAHRGRAFCFVPETADATPWTDVYWVIQQGDIRQVAVDEIDGPRYDASVTLIEVK